MAVLRGFCGETRGRGGKVLWVGTLITSLQIGHGAVMLIWARVAERCWPHLYVNIDNQIIKSVLRKGKDEVSPIFFGREFFASALPAIRGGSNLAWPCPAVLYVNDAFMRLRQIR